MTTHFNHLALSGRPVTDEDFCSTFGIDPTVANTYQLNSEYLKSFLEALLTDHDVPKEEIGGRVKQEIQYLNRLLARNGLYKSNSLTGGK